MAAKAIKYIGRTTDFKGKTLWEIVGDLKDFGVGRLVVRNMFQRYPEPCYMRILKVETVDAENSERPRKVKVTVEKTWRGVTIPKPVEIFSSSYKADYELIDKEDEHKFLQNSSKIVEKILSTHVELPPLLREFVSDETGEKNPQMKVHFKSTDNKFVRLAKDGEKPNVFVTMGLGQPAPVSLKLYEGVL
ncbi:mitochondrial ribosomal protein S34 [Haematobia irritans]|uniref:Putative mitochondrial ribosomal protein s34 n=2 Tax=Haematobia irritans TaxID=7368 RepID=A0A1L8EH17_HAEIR